MKRQSAVRAVLLAALVLEGHLAYPCTLAVGYFHQVTNLRGTVVGTNHSWPRWLRQGITRGNVELLLYEYRSPMRDCSELPLVKMVRTDNKGRFDFGALKEGHYTLVIDWPSTNANRFDVEIKKLPKVTASVKIDVTPIRPDCTGGHEFIALLE